MRQIAAYDVGNFVRCGFCPAWAGRQTDFSAPVLPGRCPAKAGLLREAA